MSKIPLLFYLLFLSVFIMGVIGDSGCANPIAPQGGPKDTLPPRLLNVVPKDSSKNFNSNKIIFIFDEFVQMDNVHENLIVSPTPKRDPTVESKLRTITIKIKDTLEPNTTYTYDFGNAIKDLNEGNIAKNFTYVFSTGPSIDSGELSGQVVIAQTGKTDSTLIAMLHKKADDSAVIKEKPRYVARLDAMGHFNFHHLPAGTFYLYALKDESGQRKYLSKRQLFAFAEKPVTIGQNQQPVTLFAFLEKGAEELTSPAVTPSRPPPTAKADKNKDVDKRLHFTSNLENGFQDLLSPLQFKFQDRLKTFDSSKVRFTDDQYKPMSNYSIILDSSRKKITLTYSWKENTPYDLIVDKDFAEDSSGRKIPRTDTLKFKTKKESEYGSLRVRFNTIDLTKNPVLQLVQNEEIKFAERLTSKEYYKKLFQPGEYEIRILYDENGNGVWDTGEFFSKHRQPEKVELIKKKVIVKPNWDAEIDIER